MTDLKPANCPEFFHVPVLSREVVEGLAVQPGEQYLDATVGGGGHSALILAAAPAVRLTALDRDGVAIAAARTSLAPYDPQVQFWQGNFADYDPGEVRFDGILADLGVSSAQLDIPERGFSFRHTADLDMRMDRRQSLTAAEIVNHWDVTQLADLFYRYGEERFSRRIARRIVEQRPFQTTTELANAIARSLPSHSKAAGKSANRSASKSRGKSGKASKATHRLHPATRVFQALRIAVNQELASLETFLDNAPNWLKPGGRIALISFHSLEDRLVKHRLRDRPDLKILTKKPIQAQAEEQKQNPRSRSAKLRLAEKQPMEQAI